MKRYFVAIFISFLSIINSYSQPNIDFEAHQKIPDRTIGDCFVIEWSFGEGDLYFPDCPEFNTKGKWGFKVTKVDCGLGCAMSQHVYINDVPIDKLSYEIKWWDGEIGWFYLDNYLKEEARKGKTNFEIKIVMTTLCYDLTHEQKTIIKNIQIVPKNGVYSTLYFLGYEDPVGYNDCKKGIGTELFNNSLACCGKGSVTIDMGYKTENITTSGHPGETTVTIGYNFDGINLGFEQNYQIPISYVNNINYSGYSTPLTINPPSQKGKCNYAAITTTFAHYKELFYINDCNSATQDKFVEGMTKEYYIPFKFGLKQCTYDVQYNEPPRGTWKVIRSGNLIARSNCSGTLILNVERPEEVYTYTWILPDGTMFEGNNEIEMSDFGLYKCIVKNRSYEETEFQFNNCTNTTYSPWRYDPGTKMYCRQVTCQCGEVTALRESSTYTQCITPDRYDGSWNFDNGKKKCTKHAYWTDQDGNEIDLTSAVSEEDILAGNENVVKEPEDIIEYYDDWSEKCVREYRCDDNSPGYEEQEEPNYGEWQYDDWSENCYREIFCFGGNEPAKDKEGWEASDEAEGEVNWEFQEDDFICYGTVYCDNVETEIELEIDPEMEWYWNEENTQCKTTTIECDGIEQENEVFEDPSDIGDWEYDDFWDICVRDVYCETADETYEDVELVHFFYDQNNYADCDVENGEYPYQIFCGNIETDIYVCRNVPPGSIPSGQNYGTSNNITATSENKSPDKVEKNYKYYRIHVFSIDGKDRKIESVKNVSDVDNYISFFKKFRAQKNIKYFYSVYGENKFLYSKRFVIFK